MVPSFDQANIMILVRPGYGGPDLTLPGLQ